MKRLKLCRELIVRWKDRLWNEVWLRVLGTIGLAFVDKCFVLVRREFRNAHGFWSNLLKALLVRTIHQHHSSDVTRVCRLIKAHQQSTERVTNHHIWPSDASLTQKS